MMNVSIIIVSFNTQDYLRECLTAVYKWAVGAEVIVVDNASSDGSCDMVKAEFPKVKLIESNTNLGFGEGNNLCVSQAKQPYVMLLNSDAILMSDTVQQLVEYLQKNQQVSCVGPRVVLPISHQIQPKTFGYAPTLLHVFNQSLGLSRLSSYCAFLRGIDGEESLVKALSVDWISGVCMMMRTADYMKVGGFDKRFFMYCEDIDLCLRLKKFGQIIVLSTHDVMHYGGASSKTIANKARNSVWQQRNLLTIITEYQGAFSAKISTLILATGLIVKLLLAIITIPVKGVTKNAALLSTWLRLKDIAGFDALKRLM